MPNDGGLRYSALMNPTVDVNVRHPPNLGLGIERVTFGSESEPSTLERVADMLSDNLGLTSAVCGAELRQRLTDDAVIGMFNDGLDDEIIIQVIRTSDVDFDVSPATLGELQRLGLSPAVISAMIAAAG